MTVPRATPFHYAQNVVARLTHLRRQSLFTSAATLLNCVLLCASSVLAADESPGHARAKGTDSKDASYGRNSSVRKIARTSITAGARALPCGREIRRKEQAD